MAEDFYYIREQRRGNVQVGATLVLMGALYLAEGALRWENVNRDLYLSIIFPQTVSSGREDLLRGDDLLLEEAEATNDDHAGRANSMFHSRTLIMTTQKCLF